MECGTERIIDDSFIHLHGTYISAGEHVCELKKLDKQFCIFLMWENWISEKSFLSCIHVSFSRGSFFSLFSLLFC